MKERKGAPVHHHTCLIATRRGARLAHRAIHPHPLTARHYISHLTPTRPRQAQTASQRCWFWSFWGHFGVALGSVFPPQFHHQNRANPRPHQILRASTPQLQAHKTFFSQPHPYHQTTQPAAPLANLLAISRSRRRKTNPPQPLPAIKNDGNEPTAPHFPSSLRHSVAHIPHPPPT